MVSHYFAVPLFQFLTANKATVHDPPFVQCGPCRFLVSLFSIGASLLSQFILLLDPPLKLHLKFVGPAVISHLVSVHFSV